MIAPLLLLPFIENAFKHGISQKSEDSWLLIFLSVNDDGIKFSVENSIPAQVKKQQYIKDHGIGLKNVKRRLELIYGSHFLLDIYNFNDSFKIELTIGAMKIKTS
jgi:sensor histidine kinase YesM